MSNTNFTNLTVLNKKFKSNNYSCKTYNKNKIKMWTGDTPPSGYVWCDGNNDTPDLTNKFIFFTNYLTTSLGNTGNNQISDIPTHNHNASSVSIVNSTTTSNAITTARYDRINAIDSATVDSGSRRGNGSDIIPNHNHTHTVNNSNGQLLRNQVTINSINSNVTLNITKANNFNTTGIIDGVNSATKSGSQNDFIPKYIYIGFIMKL